MSRTGSTGWLLQRASGLLLFALVIAHFVLTHFMGPEKRLYADVARRFADPLWKAFDLGLLTLALAHGWYGIWGIAQDYLKSGAARVLALVCCLTAALALFSLGAVTILTFRAV
ncbi:MAG: succinate dehydrogenase, hydrophobic membrane anchor protein [Candidatus Aureabacteria bacterium]|jgi:succinate dehydrogenase / fumarate reductase membrane anchor subunit|nr:succinate dehydrogenase, hydrophobic membrane anchor protein [Candidatus Auribacterota bacterium]NLW93617.1 succinate dehydrogenase, hydrophobic membrane anchor protein [Chlamydiota bacterium]HOE28062.1 succinate dehydrogenase, hydrophobic membrane anchor protein [bacterium]HQM53625.1 succinate dehydrogenase, hydrophobic membrane anchor protein [bacterium]